MYGLCLGELATLKRAMNDRARLVEGSVAKAVLVICLFLDGGGWAKEEVEPFRTSLAREEEGPRAYAADRFQLTEEQNYRIELLALGAALRVLSVPARREGRAFLAYSLDLPAGRDGLALLGLGRQQVDSVVRRLGAGLAACRQATGESAPALATHPCSHLPGIPRCGRGFPR
jgi:hypothetical protein